MRTILAYQNYLYILEAKNSSCSLEKGTVLLSGSELEMMPKKLLSGLNMLVPFLKIKSHLLKK